MDIENGNNEIDTLTEKMDDIIKRSHIIESKLDTIICILQDTVSKNTEKMANHIDFIETVYNNVKSPLGFLCNKLNYLKGNDPQKYSLEHKQDRTGEEI